MKILLDNAILVRASGTRRGLARELLLQIVESQHNLLLSNEMLYELAKVLRYPRMLALHGLSEERVYDYIGFLRQVAEIVALNPLFTAPVRDAGDIIVMQTAIVGEADVLCTNRECRGSKRASGCAAPRRTPAGRPPGAGSGGGPVTRWREAGRRDRLYWDA